MVTGGAGPVVVAGDGSALADPSTVRADLRRVAVVLRRLAGVPVRTLPLDVAGPDHLDQRLAALAEPASAVVLTRVNADRAARVQAAWGLPPVVADRDAAAIVTAAKVISALSGTRRGPRSADVVVVGAGEHQALGPVLMAAGVHRLTEWNHVDGDGFDALREFSRRAHVIVDLVGGLPWTMTTRSRAPTPAVVTSPGRREELLVLPGLVRALAVTPDATLDVHVRLACALALVLATPDGRLAPPRHTPALRGRISSAASSAMRPDPDGQGAVALPHDTTT